MAWILNNCSFGTTWPVVLSAAGSNLQLDLQIFFIQRPSYHMLLLYKTLLLFRLEYGSQLWCLHKNQEMNTIKILQKSFTKRLHGMQTSSYQEWLKHLALYSHQRRREKNIIIYLWRKAELQVLDLDPQHLICKPSQNGFETHLNKLYIQHQHLI